jgi:hypothetical protein
MGENMEEVSRRTAVTVIPATPGNPGREGKPAIPVQALWRAFNDPDAKLTGWGRRLEEYYYTRYPENHFSHFFAIRDQKLQDAFQLAVAQERRDPTALRLLFEEDWTWLSCWSYEDDPAGETYLRARYLLMSGWTGVLLDPCLDQVATLKQALTEIDICLDDLSRDRKRPGHLDLTMRATKLKISILQRLHLVEHKKHLPVTKTLDHAELNGLLDYLLSKVTAWPKSHFNRWQWARDAVTISSGLHLIEQCARAYAVLLVERPDFANIDHKEWTVGPAAEDPDLNFFRQNIDAIRNNN